MGASRRHNKLTIPDNDSQAAGTTNHDVPPPKKKSHKSPSPLKGTPKYISQDNDHVPGEASKTASRTNKVPDVPTQVLGTDDDPEEASQTEARTNEVLAAPTQVLRTVSDEYSKTATRMNAEAGNSKANIQQRKTPPIYPKVYGEESWVGTEWPDVCKYRVCEGHKFGYYEMKKKGDNFQSLLWHVHGEREVGDKKPLYGCNVVNYVTIMKYMILYQEILHLTQWIGVCGSIKPDDGSSHNSQDHAAVMKQFLDDLIADLALQVSMSQSHNQATLDKYFKSKCFVPDNESKDYVCKKLMNSAKPRAAFCQALHFLWLDQQIFVEHIPYVFREIFITDLEVLCIPSWVEILIHYSYLPESGKIFTPLTEFLAKFLVEKTHDLFMAKLEVVFLSQTTVQNIDEHFGKDCNVVYLSGVFKHLKGTNFKHHALLDFKSWNCFEDTKADLQQNFKESQTGPYGAYAAGWYTVNDNPPPCDGDLGNDGDNKINGDDGNVTNGPLDNNDGLKPAANNLNESGNNGDNNLSGSGNNSDNVSNPSQDKGNKSDERNNSNESGNTTKTKTVGTKSSVVKKLVVNNLEVAPKDWRNESEEMMLKDPDPEILYSIYQIGQKVVDVRDAVSHIGLVDAYVSERYKIIMRTLVTNFFQPDDGTGTYEWFPFFKSSGEVQRKNKGKLSEDDDPKSSSTSTGTSDNEHGSDYDLEDNSNSEAEEEDRC
eukprot:jgi/Psemu1/26852/gm1.26852_g